MMRKLMPNMLWVCMHQCDDHAFQGELYTVVKKDRIKFNDFNEFVLQADRIFDEMDFPQSFQEKRSFQQSNPQKAFLEARKNMTMDHQLIGNHRGDCFTAIIMVNTRQYTNWQGVVMNDSFEVLFVFDDIVQLMNAMMKLKDK